MWSGDHAGLLDSEVSLVMRPGCDGVRSVVARGCGQCRRNLEGEEYARFLDPLCGPKDSRRYSIFSYRHNVDGPYWWRLPCPFLVDWNQSQRRVLDDIGDGNNKVGGL